MLNIGHIPAVIELTYIRHFFISWDHLPTDPATLGNWGSGPQFPWGVRLGPRWTTGWWCQPPWKKGRLQADGHPRSGNSSRKHQVSTITDPTSSTRRTHPASSKSNNIIMVVIVVLHPPWSTVIIHRPTTTIHHLTIIHPSSPIIIHHLLSAIIRHHPPFNHQCPPIFNQGHPG